MHVQQHLHNAAMAKETKHLIFFALSYMYGMYFFKYKNYIMQSFVVVRGWKYFTLSLKTLDLNVSKGINRIWNYYADAKQYFIGFILGGVKFGDFQRFQHAICLTSLMLGISNSSL